MLYAVPVWKQVVLYEQEIAVTMDGLLIIRTGFITSYMVEKLRVWGYFLSS